MVAAKAKNVHVADYPATVKAEMRTMERVRRDPNYVIVPWEPGDRPNHWEVALGAHGSKLRLRAPGSEGNTSTDWWVVELNGEPRIIERGCFMALRRAALLFEALCPTPPLQVNAPTQVPLSGRSVSERKR